MAKKPKVHMLKKVKEVPYKLPKNGKVCVRPVSFHMDKLIDKYVITGAGHEPVIVGGKREAMVCARARVRVMVKHQARRRQRKR